MTRPVSLLRHLSCWLALAAPLELALPAVAQPARPCGTDSAMRAALGPDYERWTREYIAQLADAQRTAQRAASPQSPPPAGPHIIVPIVVHIIHTNGADNIPDQQVVNAIEELNRSFLATDPDTAQVTPYFKPRVGNANIEFRLAKLDPQGNCTNGITRHFSPLTTSAGENVKNLPGARWTPQRYLNVWVVERIASGAGGYSYLPCGVGPSQEGIVVLNTQFGSGGRTSPGCQLCVKTLAHEVGHYLGLPHTWGPTNTPGAATNCGFDDGISDTPNTVGASQNCNLMMPSCIGDPDSIANVQNVMDYSSCPSMFTLGQTLVMNNGLRTTFSCRLTLGSVANQIVTGTATGQVIPPCLPVASIQAAGSNRAEPVQRLCAGDSMAFLGETYNLAPGTPVQYRWTFPGGVPATSTAQQPMVTYPTPGLYDVRLRVSTTAGADSTVAVGFVRVQDTNSGLTTPLVELFEDPQFPVNSTDPLKSWEATASQTSVVNWEYTSAAATQGTGAARLQLSRTVAGAEYDLVSPTITFSSGIQQPRLRFSRAYTRRIATNEDRLTMSWSFDCGRTWQTRGGAAIRSAAQLTTAPSTNIPFVPTASQWVNDSLLLHNGILPAGTHVMVRFRVFSDRGNILYLDNLRIGGRTPTGLADATIASRLGLSISPNPSTGAAVLTVSTGNNEPATLRVYDATGRRVGAAYSVAATGAGRSREVALHTVAGPLAAGVYVVELTAADGARRTQRALVY